jgi:hypothetical protein
MRLTLQYWHGCCSGQAIDDYMAGHDMHEDEYLKLTRALDELSAATRRLTANLEVLRTRMNGGPRLQDPACERFLRRMEKPAQWLARYGKPAVRPHKTSRKVLTRPRAAAPARKLSGRS